MKKICFFIPVHEKRESIIDLIENIRYFCPHVSVVLYRSGTDLKLCDGLGYPVCPTSHPLKWGSTLIWCFLEVMEWLEDIGYEYDYLMNIDSDVLFINKGMEKFIISEMKGYEYMVSELRIPDHRWYPGTRMKPVFHLWQPFFNMNYFLAGFGPQLFSRTFIRRILNLNQWDEMKKMVRQTEKEVFALEEILFPTLAESLRVKSKPYSVQAGQWIRYRPYFTKKEVIHAVTHKDCYLIHPVQRDMDDPARTFVRSLLTRSRANK